MNWHVEQGTAIIFGLACAIIALVFLVAWLADIVVRQHAELDAEEDTDHAKCVAHIADVVSARFGAVMLRDMAERYDSVPEVATMMKIKREVWTPDGPTMPALWMLHQADVLGQTGEDT